MSTRAVYTFRDQDGEHHVYKHHDGYPSGAASAINATLNHAWPLPRFEADEFAAAFIAANKSHSGGIRLMQSGPIKAVAPGDIEYRYEITIRGRALHIHAFATDYWANDPGDKTETQIFSGSLEAFTQFVGKMK